MFPMGQSPPAWRLIFRPDVLTVASHVERLLAVVKKLRGWDGGKLPVSTATYLRQQW